MPLTPEQVKTLEANQSHFGCGRYSCIACYPIEYRCPDCGEDYPNPIANGERHECEACGYDNWAKC